MSVALELEYDALYPRLRVVPKPGRVEHRAPEGRRRVVLAVMAVVVLLVLLVLPLRALGGTTTVTPSAGREYVVRSGDTLASIAARVGGRNVAALERRLADEAGSNVLVPGEHLLIP